MYGAVDVDVDIVQKIVILVPVSAPFALKTLELIINNRLHVKKLGWLVGWFFCFGLEAPISSS